MIENQCLETHLNLRRDLVGRQTRIWFNRSSLLAMVSADKDGWQEIEETFGVLLLLFALGNMVKLLVEVI